MRVHYVAFLCVSFLWLTACSKSPAGPSETSSATLLHGQTVGAIDGAAAAGLSVQVGAARAVKTDGSGYFQTDVGVSEPGQYATAITGGAIVERHTTVTGPNDRPARLSLIPASFDLQAFNQMFRTANARLQRWTTRPSLVVLATVMAYRGSNGDEYSATSEQLTGDEVSLMVAHLTEGLALLTGGTFTAFESIEIERPSAGDRVSVTRPGKIVVGRYTGVVSFAQTIGFGRWKEEDDGSVDGGATFFDRDFDRNDGRRRLLRIHELGHALGYTHVTARTSIMNPSIGPEPTDFDRAGAIIAFQRTPGNVTPDTDPSSDSHFGTGSLRGGRWADPVFCR